MASYPLDRIATDAAASVTAMASAGEPVRSVTAPAGPGAARLAGVLDALPVSVIVTNAAGWVTYANRAAVQLTGCVPNLGKDRWCLAHRLFRPDGTPLPHDQCPLAATLREGHPLRGAEMVLERPDGQRVSVLPHPTLLFDEAGALVGALDMLIDIGERKPSEPSLAASTRRDALTALPNRIALVQDLAERVTMADGGGHGFCLLRLDVDRLKALNDEHGPGFGDAVLLEVAGRLTSGLPEMQIWRSGGDEFAVATRPDAAGSDAAELAQRVRALFDPPFQYGDRCIQLGMTGGIARYPDDALDAVRLAACANTALHMAKSTERGSIRMFDPLKQALDDEKRLLREQLATAIAEGQIRLFYQPLFRPDGSIAGFEALARWRHPERGEISPADFIAEAEAAGLIAALDTHVLQSACREAASWRQPLSVAVNISPLEFLIGDLPERVEAVLLETGLDPERLELEITESIMVTDAEKALTTLGRLRALGVGIALDDFGTGYSSLSYLHRFPLTTL
ncbi:MAG: putative bifunctional diguanylate cyclase/phosphodiesterase, partial [Bosea sp. (in: a-proteobacteria)]